MKNSEHLPSERSASLLVVGSTEEDFPCLRNICTDAGWKLHEARSIEQARTQMYQNTIAVVLWQYEMVDGDWTELLDGVSGPVASPYVIVWSRHADARVWAEVLNLGGYDVLAAPFQGSEVAQAVDSGIRRSREWGVAAPGCTKTTGHKVAFRPNQRSVA